MMKKAGIELDRTEGETPIGVTGTGFNQIQEDEEPPGSFLSHISTINEKHLKDHFPTEKRSCFRAAHFPAVSDREWNSWQWQFRNRITDPWRFSDFISLSESERMMVELPERGFPVSVTPYYLSLIDPEDPEQPLRKCVIPRIDELSRSSGEGEDPLGEEGHRVAPGLYHRYPDRVLFLATDTCSVNCRYCTRSRIVGRGASCVSGEIGPVRRYEAALDYIRQHREVRDVLISGGDPLTLSDSRLEQVIAPIRAIPHVEVIRIGTKVPMVLPQRITHSLTSLLRRYHPLWMSIHVTHPEEITPESTEALRRLADAGIPLGSQTVLLKGVNDATDTLKALFQGMMRLRVKPYYLYQCDPISGSAHFRTPVEKGIEIIRGLRGHTSGYAVPQYVIDAPGGGGKVPIAPDYIVRREGTSLVLRNYEGKLYTYPDGGQ